ncbi:MAG: Maf family protein [Rhodomicrobiaceae bacterium]
MPDRSLSVSAQLILASASSGRADILRGAAMAFIQRPAAIDERALEADLVRREGGIDAGRLALALAAAKAEAISAGEPDFLVIGADQVMECAGVLYQKPPDVEAARDQLLQLRGRTHRLNSGICAARSGRVEWRHLAVAELTMCAFSERFLDDYCRAEGPAMLLSVGSYRIEGRGIQLFSKIEGDYFTIIGLPLLPLLGYLRDIGWLAS